MNGLATSNTCVLRISFILHVHCWSMIDFPSLFPLISPQYLKFIYVYNCYRAAVAIQNGGPCGSPGVVATRVGNGKTETTHSSGEVILNQFIEDHSKEFIHNFFCKSWWYCDKFYFLRPIYNIKNKCLPSYR